MRRQAIALRNEETVNPLTTRFQLIAGIVQAASQQAAAGERDRAIAMLDAAGTLIESERKGLTVRVATADEIERPRRRYQRKPKAARKPRRKRVELEAQTNFAGAPVDAAAVDRKIDAAPRQVRDDVVRTVAGGALRAAAPADQVNPSVTENGVTVELGAGAESFEYRGVKHRITAKQAKFVLCLARALGQVIGRDHIIKKVWGANAAATIETTLSSMASDMKTMFAKAGLELKTVRGIGYALVPMEV